MQPLVDMADAVKQRIAYILTDIDDTLTTAGRLPSEVFAAMEAARRAGLRVVPVTGRPAGWCDHIARMWPVDGLVGENGAFYFHYDPVRKTMRRTYAVPEDRRRENRRRLEALAEEILAQVPGCRVSADQAYREVDLAIDFCEDVPALPPKDVDRIVAIFTRAGAVAKVSSIHVNGWFGSHDKLSMTRTLFEEVFATSLEAVRENVLFIGDSPNDAPMFAFFPASVGVANVRHFTGRLDAEPRWVTTREGGLGFAEMVAALLSGR